jgi:mono/diheme cytochrome c family protein
MVELTTAAVYYYTWGRIPDELHLKVGWVYAVSSLFTLVIINGILTFMLTPGDAWLAVAMTGKEADYFWSAYFNPTFWPSLCLRTLVCVSLAGIWALVTCSRLDGDVQPKLKTALIRWSAKWLIPSFLLLPLAMGWYLWQVPESQRALLSLGISTIGTGAFTQLTRVVLLMIMTSATIVLVVYFLAWRSAAEFTLSHALAVLLLALIATASGEYAREMLRKPFVIGQHMYSNGLRVKLIERYKAEGYLTHSPWIRKSEKMDPKMAVGEAMFRGQCLACHTRDAYRSMQRLLVNRNREAIGNMLQILYDHKDPYRRYMPPLVGTKAEIESLGDYLATLTPAGKTAGPQPNSERKQ